MTVESAREPEGTPAQSEPADKIEPRWPVALAVVFFIGITVAVRVAEPHRETLGPHWLVPGLEVALLVALLAADPARAVGRRSWLRPVAIALVVALVVLAMSSRARIVNRAMYRRPPRTCVGA